MTRTNLETELTNAWNETLADLTPAERKALAAATPADWASAITDCITDPGFWGEMATAFLRGMERGLTR